MKRKFSFTSIFNALLLVGILYFFFPVMCAQAQNAQGLKLGDTIIAQVPICLNQKAAMTVAETDHKSGPEAAVATIMKEKDCGFGTMRVKLVKVVKQFTTARGADLKVVEVLVEMRDDSWKTAWILADVPIQGAFTT